MFLNSPFILRVKLEQSVANWGQLRKITIISIISFINAVNKIITINSLFTIPGPQHCWRWRQQACSPGCWPRHQQVCHHTSSCWGILHSSWRSKLQSCPWCVQQHRPCHFQKLSRQALPKLQETFVLSTFEEWKVNQDYSARTFCYMNSSEM